MTSTRRDFLLGTMALGAGALLRGQDPPAVPPVQAMPRRPLGRTGLQVGIVGLGTAPLGTLPDDQEDAAVAVVRRALELGANYLDTAPSYDRHRAERRIGKAIAGRRDDVVLATKSFHLQKQHALLELEQSLQALGTDRVDVFQVHAVTDHEDRKRKLDADAGTLAAALQARKDGKCRFIGVTGHAMPEVIAQCLRDFAFDTVLVPVNAADPLWRSFVGEVLPVAKERGAAVVAMKVFASGALAKQASAAECVRWALSQDVALAVPGCKTVAELEADVAAVRPWQAMSEAEQQALTRRFAPHPGNALEWYKREQSAPQGGR